MSVLSGLEHICRENEPLAPYTWFRLGGAAEYFAEPTTVEELAQLVKRCRQEDMPVRLLGGGSNILVRDEGAPGMVIHLSSAAFAEIRVEGCTIKAGAGAKLGHVISTSVREGLAGLEPLVGIPGSVGGALKGNVGANSGDIGQWTSEVLVMSRSGEVAARSRDDLRFGYRQSNVDELVILQSRFELEEDDAAELTKRMQKLWIVKKSSQPGGGQCTGLVFKNPGGDNAASLIEQAGLKGARIGQAEVCDQHANFIIANPGATSGDVLRLIDLMQGQVRDRTGVELELGLEIW